ncbi:MAG: hypothetical protein M1119_10240 [Firmicutes bacterium]|nr:hypothetical protein [Bacillota bacterium]
MGPVKLLKTEKVRGNVRLHFICGERTIQWMCLTAETLHQLEQAAGASGSEAILAILGAYFMLGKLCCLRAS